jgi:DNA-binding winged helix-turn-helix (wHTH) protein
VKPDEVKRSYEFGPFRLDPEDRTLSRDGELVPLTIKAFDTLLVLVENAGQLLSKDEMMRRVWPETVVEENNLAQQVSFLRKALAESETGVKYIETLPKRGYRFLATPGLVADAGVGLIVREKIRGRVLVEEEVEDDAPTEATLAHTTAERSLPPPAPSSRVREKAGGHSFNLPRTPGPGRHGLPCLACALRETQFAAGYQDFGDHAIPKSKR